MYSSLWPGYNNCFVGELAIFTYTFLDMASLSITHIDTKFSQIYSLLYKDFLYMRTVS